MTLLMIFYSITNIFYTQSLCREHHLAVVIGVLHSLMFVKINPYYEIITPIVKLDIEW